MAVSRSNIQVPVTGVSERDNTASSHAAHHHQHQQYQPGMSNGGGGEGSSIPSWFEVSSFRYNGRILIGFTPGILLLGVVLGKTFFAVLLFGFMVLLLLRSLEYIMAALVVTVLMVLSCQITNFYLMVPLMWHSPLNIPMFMLLNVFIAVTGTWGMLLNTEFLKQDPRVVLLVEKGLFILVPGLDLAMVGWVSGLLWGKEYLALILGFTGVAICSLFIVPLQSSFVKQRTPQNTGLILPKSVALSYMLLASFLPGVINAAIDHRSIFTSSKVFLKYQAYFACPVFALTLLEAQGIFYWFGSGVSEKIIKYFRLFVGGTLMALLAYLVYTIPSSTVLPSLAVILLFGMLALTTSLDSDHTHLPLPSLILAGIVSVVYFVSSFEIRWTTSYTFSLLSIPYFLVQLLLLLLGLLSVALLLTWRRDLTVLWPTYHAVFVGCEFILHKESLYPVPMLMSTAAAAVLLCLRLHSVGRLPLPITLMCVMLHVVKLFQVLPLSPLYTSSLSAVTVVGSVLTGLGLLKLSSSNKHSLTIFCVCCVAITAGLAMCVESFVSPLLTAVTHTPPSGADLAAVVLLASGYVIQQYLPTVAHSKHHSLAVKLPSSLFLMAMLVWVLQVDFNVVEIAKAVAMLAVHHADVNSFMGKIVTTEQLSLMAWLVLVKWVVVAYAGFSIAAVILSDIITIIPFFAAIWLLGSGIGMWALLVLAHQTPLSLLGILYVLIGSTVTLLISVVAYSNVMKHAQFAVSILFCILLGLVLTVLPWEWSMPLVTDIVHIPSSFIIMIGLVSVALTMKIGSLMNRGIPNYPIICNISCLLAFLLAILFPLPVKLDHTLTVSLSSCVVLLTQPDGIVVPKRQGLFLAPSLLLSSLTLFFVILSDTLNADLTTGYAIQLVCLVASVPGQLKLISSLWRDVPMRFSILTFMLYIAPNACLAQFGGNPNVVYGCTAILCFSLLMMAEFQTLKTI